MHPEIEKLIDLALADGQITEKERNVILKKASELGVDSDEIEMTLDGRLHQIQAYQTKPSKEKVGNIKTCPACGESVKSLELICSACSHEFTIFSAENGINSLLRSLKSINIDDYEDEDNYYKKIASLIKSSLVPSSATDLYEFGIKAVAEIEEQNDYWREDSVAWKNKAEDCIMKLKLVELQNEKYHTLRLELEKSLEKKVNCIKKNSNKSWLIIILVIIFILLFILFYKYFIK
jgi:hypothetical protein